jgi:hypothetical protein
MSRDEMTESAFLRHSGVLRKSGRYPWGSGANPEQRGRSFLGTVEKMRKDGMTEVEIARAFHSKEFPFTTSDLRALKKIASNEVKKADQLQAMRLKEKGYTNVKIGELMGGKNESSVRALLDPVLRERADTLDTIAGVLRDAVAENKYVDFGAGNENSLGVSETMLKTAVAMLKEEGHTIHYVQVPQQGTGNKTSLKVLSGPEATYKEVYNNREHIKPILARSDDGGRTFSNLGLLPVLNVDPKRVAVRYAEEGGAAKDGVIEIRRGVKDLDMGNARYAQVRIGVGGTHYLKGMAVYSDNIPDGHDMVFNTNKSDTGDKLKAMKPQLQDENPFGSAVRQITVKDKHGNEKVVSALNIVNEEGDWTKWSSNLSSQMLSKQPAVLARKQLAEKFDAKQKEFDEINALTNPAVKKKLLEAFADGADSSAVHLKAAGLPRTATHVILPINSLKDTEVYAPKYRDGEKVVLIRHPHGGTFEIPELTVNNRNREANSVMKQARDAIGINSKVAERLSGADFDGDTVLVIPNPQAGPHRVQTSAPLASLKNFDPKMYKLPDDAPKMSAKTKGQQMGDVSNLITDMTIRQAPFNDIARAVKHSMVVIDAEKHHLDYKQSAKDNGIRQLKQQYQGKTNAGASTLISKAKSEARIPQRKARPAGEGGAIDPKTGRKMFVNTGATYSKYDPVTKLPIGEPILKTQKVKKLELVDDAHTLSSGTVIESVYADHSNKLKALANTARKESYNTTLVPYNQSANKAYKAQVDSLKGSLNTAMKNKPLERQAQLIAESIVTAKKQAEPDMDPAQLKKIRAMAQKEGRARTGAEKPQIKISPKEWEAIQAGAISNNMLKNILDMADLDLVKALATPRQQKGMSTAQQSRAKAMIANGHSLADVAAALGVSTKTLDAELHGQGG